MQTNKLDTIRLMNLTDNEIVLFEQELKEHVFVVTAKSIYRIM